jgi:molecular chaperone DnaK
LIADKNGARLTPSVVHFPADGSPLVGEPAARMRALKPAQTIYSIKRFMGLRGDDLRESDPDVSYELERTPGKPVRVIAAGKEHSPEEISALILGKLKADAEAALGHPVSRAVITVPAYFNDAQRDATKRAGELAGFTVERVVNEPTAAALAYGLDKLKGSSKIAVFDLGGGTFDISILKLHDGIFEVIATNGDTHLGGDDIDNLLITIALDDIRGDMNIDLRRNAEAVQAIRKAVIDAKIALSSQPSIRLDIDVPGGQRYQREITREQYEQLIQPVIGRTVGPCKQALKDAGLRPEQIDEVVLVGGSTRIPKVRALVKELFRREPHTDLNPDEVVALGAAVQANILGGGCEATENMLLLDVTPLSLGIEVAGGVTDKIILRNSTIPASATQHYTTQVDGQANVAIHVLQGERELATDCRSLARFDLKGIPAMAAGMPRVEVKFLIDANGILHVSAREQRSGKEAEIQVQPSYGLTDEQVEGMILDSFDNAEEDFRRRQVIEARNETKTILDALEKGKKSPAWGGITTDEKKQIARMEKALVAMNAEGDYQAIRQAIDALNQGTTRLAELMMDTAVSTALKGKNMDETDLGEGPTAPHPMAKAEFE